MKKVLLTIAMSVLSISIYAQGCCGGSGSTGEGKSGGKNLGEQTAGDYMVAADVVGWNKVVEKSPANFRIQVFKGENKVEDATTNVNFYTKADGYVCPMHKEVQMDKPGKCPKCGMELEKGEIRKKIVSDAKAKSGKYKQNFNSAGKYEMEINVHPKNDNAFTVSIPFEVEKKSDKGQEKSMNMDKKSGEGHEGCMNGMNMDKEGDEEQKGSMDVDKKDDESQEGHEHHHH